MTTIQNIPEELLLDIFSNLSVRDLINCQSVCQSWYIPARVKQLNNNVILTSVAKVERFITTINKNPSSRFLAAVKEIEIRHTQDWNVTDAVLDNLFFRFPNLEKVTINETLLNSFDDNVCKTFLSHCPKLADLEVYELGPRNHQNLLNIRLLLTRLVLQRSDHVQQVVPNFPRLKSLYSRRRLNNFESLLTVLGYLADLRLINISGLVNTSDDFPEKYLQTQTAEVRQQLLERISRINDLDLGRADILSKSVLLFISKYMTGLESIKIETILPNNNPQQIHLSCTMFSMLRASNLCLITINMPIDIL